MPESGATSNSGSSRDPLFTCDDRIDMTDLNPFHLFDRMFPHMAGTFSRTRDEAGRAEDSLSSSEKATSEDRPLSDFGKGVEKGNSRKLEESYTRARIDRNGRAHVSTGQRSMKVHKNGGFTFESRTFSASSNTGGMDMMQAMLSQMNMGAGTFGGESGFLAGSSSARGMFAPSPLAYTSGTPPPLLPRVRRSSFGSLEDPYYPSSLMPATSRSLSRRSSRSFDASDDFGSSAMGFGSDNRLVSRRDEDSALGRFSGW